MSYFDKFLDAAALRGLTLTHITKTEDTMHFATTDGRAFRIFHEQSCCENVRIHDITGDLFALIGSPLVVAREDSVADKWPEDVPAPEYYPESYTWTTHWLESESHKVRIRWLGTSNGYYGESVQIEEIQPGAE